MPVAVRFIAFLRSRAEALVVLLAVGACLAGCSGGGSTSAGDAGGSATSLATVELVESGARENHVLATDVTLIEVSGKGADGEFLYGPVTVALAPVITLTDVPRSVTVLELAYRTSSGIPRHYSTVPVDLTDGTERVSDPPLRAGATVPATLVNSSQHAMNVYIFGLSFGAQEYVSDASGTIQAYTAGVSVPSVATVPAGGTATINLPTLSQARVYFSSQPLTFSNYEQTDLQGTALFDFVEYDYGSAGGLFTSDTSCVEAFGLPFQVQATPSGNVNGSYPSTGVGIVAGGRAQIFSAIRALGAPWTSLIVSSGGTDLRVLNPYHGDLVGFQSDYLASSISQTWGIAMTLNSYLYSGGSYVYYTAPSAAGGAWTFTSSANSADTVTFAQAPDTFTAFSCNIPFTTTGNGAGATIRDILSAGLNRGTLLYPNLNPTQLPFTNTTPGQPDYTPTDFYQTPSATQPYAVPGVNHFSQVIHTNSINGWNFGFATDNYGDQSSQMANDPNDKSQSPNGQGIQSLTITVQSF